MSDEIPVLDDEILAGLREIMEDEFPLLVASFLAETTDSLRRLDDAVAAADADTVFAIAHSIKSSAGNMGANALAEQARLIEALGRAGSLHNADSLLAAAQRAFAQVRERLEA